MDVHRCRFVEYPPSAINALAFSHNSGSAGSKQPLRLAIGRANGDIEIWDPARGVWIHEITLRGGKQRTVDGLAWIHDLDETDDKGYTTYGKLRLFSIGYSNAITEWDLITGLPIRQSSGSHSDVWCLSAQPEWTKSERQHAQSKCVENTGDRGGQNLAAGCADGSIILYSTADDTLNFKKYISRSFKKKARTLCLAWQNRNIVVGGFSDSAIRVYDARNGNLVRNLSLAGGPRGAPKETLVWALECLPDGTIVSGDSNGEVCFWDKYNYGQLQRIKGHQADVLCLAAGDKGRSVFSGGMDRRTAVYGLNDSRRWSKTAHRRFHEHDAKTMAQFENSKFSLVMSGGPDAYPIVIPAREFGTEHIRKLPYTPQTPPVTSGGRFLVSWWNTQVTIWRVRSAGSQIARVDVTSDQTNYEVVASMALKADEYVTSASLSSRGELLVVATVAEIKLFSLLPRRKLNDQGIKVKKIEGCKEALPQGARLIQISPDCKWLAVVDCSSRVCLARIVESSEKPHNHRLLPYKFTFRRLQRDEQKQNRLSGSWGSYYRIITRLAFSNDSRILAASDLAGCIDTWVLQGDENMSKSPISIATPRKASPISSSSASSSDSASDSGEESSNNSKATRCYDQYWRRNPASHLVPKMPSTPLVLSFQPQTSLSRTNNDPADKLLIVTSNHEIHVISVLSGRLTPWSRCNASSNSSTLLPEEFRLHRDRVVGCVWDVRSEKRGMRVWLYGSSWVCMFDLTQDLPRSKEESQKQEVNSVSSDDQSNGGIRQNALTKPKAKEEKKRKLDRAWEEDREQTVQRKLQSKRNTSGAAGSHTNNEDMSGTLDPRKMRRLDKDGNRKPVKLAPSRRERISNEDDEESGAETVSTDAEQDYALAARRRQDSNLETATSFKPPLDGEDIKEPENEQTQVNGINQKENTTFDKETRPNARRRGGEVTPYGRPPPFYITNQYRPILGIVPLTPPDEDPVNQGQGNQNAGAALTKEDHKSREIISSKHVESENGNTEYSQGSRTPLANGKSRAGKKRRTDKLVDGSPAEKISEGKDNRQTDFPPEEDPLPEFAIVERPFWDLDLPPRFVGNQEWIKGDG